MTLETLAPDHADESFAFWQHESLYRFVPISPPENKEKLTARYSVLTKGCSADGSELWLNWFMRERTGGKLVGLIECTLLANKTAQIAYFVFPDYQKQGFGFEGCAAALNEVGARYGARNAQAYIDTRNVASIALIKKLGLEQIDFIEGADFFKGESSNEYLFSMALRDA